MKNVLVVVDMQNDFVDGSLGSLQAQAIVPEVVSLMQRQWDEICVTYDTHDTDYLSTHEGRYLPVEHCIKDTPGWQLNAEVQQALTSCENVRIFEKPTFGSQLLAQHLKEMNPDNIVICGLCTDICVISNALLLRAALPETEITVKENACAGVSEDSHQAALTIMKACHIKTEK